MLVKVYLLWGWYVKGTSRAVVLRNVLKVCEVYIRIDWGSRLIVSEPDGMEVRSSSVGSRRKIAGRRLSGLKNIPPEDAYKRRCCG